MTNIITNTNITQISQETINSVLIDILKGAKSAGGEIYGASKVGIVKAVDFAQEQTPLVVQEFLSWNFAHSIIRIVISILLLIVFVTLIKKCFSKKWMDESSDMSIVPGVFSCVISLLIFFNALIPNIEKSVKIKVAPRVYTIEWVGDQINTKK